MRVWIAAAEAAPYVKVGGLGDVVGGLFRHLAALGVETRLLLPGHPHLARSELSWERLADVTLPFAGAGRRLGIRRARDGGGEIVRVDDAPFFGRPGVYVDPDTGEGYPDNARRFALFSRAVALLSGRDPTDLLFLHDAHTALVPVFLRLVARTGERSRPATVLTLHNLAHQLVCDPEDLVAAGVPRRWMRPSSALEFHGRANPLKAGILHADALTTVSETYAREILTAEHGCGLEGALRRRVRDLTGIRNGVETAIWNPRTDAHLPANYDASDLSGKETCRRALAAECGLSEDDGWIAAFVGRLVPQKGVDLIVEAADDLLARGLRLVLLGRGLADLEAAVVGLARRRPDRVFVRIGFDESLAHRIEAGADLFLMPSRFEPCGLNQMYSQLYGTIPVVRRTGGLADTVVDVDEDPGRGTGFVFDGAEPAALVAAVERAVALLADPARRLEVQRRGMSRDFSMRRTAARYLALFERVLARRREETAS